MTHTAGPWSFGFNGAWVRGSGDGNDRSGGTVYAKRPTGKYLRGDDGSFVPEIQDKIQVCTVYYPPRETEEGRANGLLIAAAPDLLEALQLVCDTYGFDASVDSSIWQTAFAAITKATKP